MEDFWGNTLETAASRSITAGAIRAPLPAWIDPTPYKAPPTADPHFVMHGVCVLLDESQVDLCGPERAWYYHRADLVTAPAGAERAAQFSVAFDPAFQRLEIHAITVIRVNQRIEHLDKVPFEVLRREQNLERLIFDGRITVHATLPDVRAGDVVETAYTVYGMRKSFNNKHGAWITLDWAIGICDARVRLRAPASRQIAVRGVNGAPDPVVKEADGIVDKSWRVLDRPAAKFEQLKPPWLFETAALQFSEWRDWGDVAATFAPLYEETAPPPAALETEIARIAAAETTPEGRAVAALRFVQGDLRYLAIAIGEGGHRPRQLADICDTRYGDCKDKSKLYVVMARRLGLDACPALVNTASGYGLDTWLPSGVVFDHCIVRLQIDDKIYWVDGTRGVQRSPLNALSQSHYGFALALRPGVTALEKMPDIDPINSLQAVEKVSFGTKKSDPIRYQWRITSRRGRAEAVREQFAREGEVGMFKVYAEDIQRAYPSAHPVEQKVEDNLERNEITVSEIYEITDGWIEAGAKSVRFFTYDVALKRSLAALPLGERKYPIYLGTPARVTRRIDVESARKLPMGGWSREVFTRSVSYKTEMRRISDKSIAVDQSLNVRAMTLPASEADKYRAIAAELERNELSITWPVDARGYFVAKGGPGGQTNWVNTVRWIWLGLILLYWLVRIFAG